MNVLKKARKSVDAAIRQVDDLRDIVVWITFQLDHFAVGRCHETDEAETDGNF